MGENHICKKCGGIAGWDSYFQSWVCTRCGNEEPKPITNGDRIRAMSDEELAEYFPTHASLCPDLEENKTVCKGANFMANNKMCRQCWLSWLKQEDKRND